MKRHLDNLYVAQEGNKVIVYGTNLKDFIISLGSVVPNLKPYMFYYRAFKATEYMEHVHTNGKTIYLQKVL
jgi:ATP-dependent Clp protease adapter protein ClpS